MLGWRREKQKYICENNAEFEIQLKCEKTKLHSRYIVCISIGIVVWLVATGKANTEEFSSWISFASTVASIILSVIAIIMSITGENKTNTMRDKMEEASRKIEKASEAMEKANDTNKENIEDLKENINLLEKKIEELKGVNTKVLEQVRPVKSDRAEENRDWANKNGKQKYEY